MGLDMYLVALPRVKDYTLKQVYEMNLLVSEHSLFNDGVVVDPVFEPYFRKEKLSSDLTYSTMSKELGYWRQANHIHKWFVDNVQDGIDDCGYYEVSEEALEELKRSCMMVLEKPESAPDLLPTQDGFFFGNTEYNTEYFEHIRETIRIIESAMELLRNENVYIYYMSWW